MNPPSREKHAWLQTLGSALWVRVHIGLLAIGAVLMLCINLLWGGPHVWALTAIGIWALLLIVHVILLAISRLTIQLLEDEDEEEVVLLPLKDAVIVATPAADSTPTAARTDPTSTWSTPEPKPTAEESPSAEDSPETVSWEIATNAARLQRSEPDEPSEPNA